MGAFAAPNRAGVMNSLPPQHRGVGSGMNSTFQNSAQVLSIGIFFTLMILGLSATLPRTLYHGLVSHGVPAAAAHKAAHLPPVSTLFAAFLGLSPIQHLIGAKVLAHLPAGPGGRAHRSRLLSGPDLEALRQWAARGLRLLDRRLPRGGVCFMAAGWQVPLRGEDAKALAGAVENTSGSEELDNGRVPAPAYASSAARGRVRSGGAAPASS